MFCRDARLLFNSYSQVESNNRNVTEYTAIEMSDYFLLSSQFLSDQITAINVTEDTIVEAEAYLAGKIITINPGIKLIFEHDVHLDGTKFIFLEPPGKVICSRRILGQYTKSDYGTIVQYNLPSYSHSPNLTPENDVTGDSDVPENFTSLTGSTSYSEDLIDSF